MKFNRILIVCIMMSLLSCAAFIQAAELSDDEKAEVKRLSAHVLEHHADSAKMNEVIDNVKFAELVLTNGAFDQNTAAMLQGLLHNGLLSQSVSQSLAQSGSSYTYLGSKKKDNQLHLTFRLDAIGLNYHVYYAEKNDDGAYQFVDLYAFNLGETMSAVLQQQFEQVLASQNPNADPQVKREAQILTKHINGVQKITQMRLAGKFKEAIDYYYSLPQIVQDNKIFLQVTIPVASASNQEVFTKLIKKYQELYGGQGSIELLMIDAYMHQKAYDKMLKTIDKVAALTYQDPVLNAYRAIAAIGKKDFELANKLAKELAGKEPNNIFGPITRIRIASAQADYKTVLNGLNDLLDEHDIFYEDLSDKEMFNDFQSSPEMAIYAKKRDAYMKQLEALE